ncbi:MAG: DMT family transporter [Armatimonadota bacterium]|nr:MAG: DMT family transporter [Armatimonadota bacterium]
MRRAYAYMTLMVVCWAVSPAILKALLQAEGEGRRLTPLEVAFWAVLLGWVALGAVIAARGRLGRVREVSGRGWVVLVLMGFFGWSGYEVALIVAFAHLPLPDAIVINYLHPVFVVVFQGAMFGSVVRLVSGWERAPEVKGERNLVRIVVGLGLCLLGVAVIATEGRLVALGGARSTVGAAVALFAAVAWGVYSNLGRFVAMRPGCEARGMGDVQTWLAMTFGVVMMGLVLLARGGTETPTGYQAAIYLGGWGPARVAAWVLMAISGVVVYCGGFTLWLVALELAAREGQEHKLPPLTYATPALAVALGCLLLREPFGPGFWEGAGLVAAGNVINVWPGKGGVRG